MVQWIVLLSRVMSVDGCLPQSTPIFCCGLQRLSMGTSSLHQSVLVGRLFRWIACTASRGEPWVSMDGLHNLLRSAMAIDRRLCAIYCGFAIDGRASCSVVVDDICQSIVSPVCCPRLYLYLSIDIFRNILSPII